MNLSFFVPGIPKPGGSKRPFMIRNKAGLPVMKNGRPIIVVTDASGKAGKDWRGDVRAAARAVWIAPPVEFAPIMLTVTFIFPRPKSHYRSGKNADLLRDGAPEYHLQKPDTTKLIRSIEDALTGLLWKDDALIVSQTAGKRWGDKPGMEITVKTITPIQEEPTLGI